MVAQGFSTTVTVSSALEFSEHDTRRQHQPSLTSIDSALPAKTHIVPLEAPSTPPSQHGMGSSSSSDLLYTATLEERVASLETKLATLSRILQVQQRNGMVVGPCPLWCRLVCVNTHAFNFAVVTSHYPLLPGPCHRWSHRPPLRCLRWSHLTHCSDV